MLDYVLRCTKLSLPTNIHQQFIGVQRKLTGEKFKSGLKTTIVRKSKNINKI